MPARNAVGVALLFNENDNNFPIFSIVPFGPTHSFENPRFFAEKNRIFELLDKVPAIAACYGCLACVAKIIDVCDAIYAA